VLVLGNLTLRGIDLEVDLISALSPFNCGGSQLTHVPVHEVQVEVLETEVLQGVPASQLDVLRVVV